MICSRILCRRTKNISVVLKRDLQQSKTELTRPEITEVQIKVPWGTIAGKYWNYGCKQPILALHGWQDNAGSFDMLAPLLKNRSILAIDAPGHGISSWLPRGIPYHDSVIIHVIRRIKRYFGWEKVKLMGHSGGAIASFRYASFYPDETEFVVAIDALQFMPLTPEKFPQSNKDVARDIDKFLIYEEKNSPAPCHTEEMAIQRWMKATHGSLNEIAARTLMIRGATKKEVDGTYYFNRDPNIRLNASNIGYTLDHLKKVAKIIKCPYILLRGTESKLKAIFSQDIIDVLQNSCKEFSVHMVPGTHHLHMVNPQGTADVINPFLDRNNVN